MSIVVTKPGSTPTQGSAAPTGGAAAPSAAPSTAAPTPPVAGGAAGGGAPAAGGAATPAAPAATPSGDALAATPSGDALNFARSQRKIRELELKLQESNSRIEKLTPLEQQLAAIRDPEKRYAELEKLGVDYKTWTERLLAEAGATPATPVAQLPAEVQQALGELAEIKARLKTEDDTRAATAQQQQMQGARAYATKLLTDHAAKYELASALGSSDSIVQEFVRRREADGVDPDEHEVCAHIEQQLETRIETVITSIGKTAKGKALLSKLMKALGAAPASTNSNGTAPTQTPAQVRVQSNGLTNDLSAESGDGVDYSRLSNAQKRKLALQKVNARTAS